MWVHIFHRDLRVIDNTTLNKVATKKQPILPIFIFTPSQTTHNKLKSNRSIQFMIESLIDLNKDLNNRLICFYGSQSEILKTILSESPIPITGFSETMDYTPYAKKRQEETQSFCKKHNIDYICEHDHYLTEPGTVLNKTKKMYQKFTRFYEDAKTRDIPRPTTHSITWQQIPRTKFSHTADILKIYKKLIPIPDTTQHIHGGRSNALTILDKFKTIIPDYDKTRDLAPSETSNLSAHNHFGTVSIREVYYKAKEFTATEFIRQLFWRDFYGHIVAAFEDLYKVSPYDFMQTPTEGWSTDKTKFKEWCEGKTGQPIVDAGIQQLLQTGYIHNRVRLVVASYLVKDLKIHWRWGEQFFAKHLIDYDFSQNFGNWCWISSVLPFSSAPFRSLNPETQQAKIDPDGTYISRWLL